MVWSTETVIVDRAAHTTELSLNHQGANSTTSYIIAFVIKRSREGAGKEPAEGPVRA